MAKKKTELTEAKEAKEEKVFATVINGNLNIRKDASTKNAPVGVLENGTKVEILDIKGEWCKVKGGYVMRQFLEF